MGKSEQSLVNPSRIIKNWCLKMDTRKYVEYRNKINRNIESSKHNFFWRQWDNVSQPCHFKPGLREAENSPLLMKFQFHTETKNSQSTKIIRDKKFCTVRCLLFPFMKLDHPCHKGFAYIFHIHSELYDLSNFTKYYFIILVILSQYN